MQGGIVAAEYACQECGRNAATRDHDVFMRVGNPICLGCMIAENLTQRMLENHPGEPRVDADACMSAEPLFTLSEKLPTEEGWYWRKPTMFYLKPYVVQVVLTRPERDVERLELCVWVASHRRYYPVAELGGVWSERIPEPGNA